ncbi:MAG: hypothetical protein F7B11_03440 [Caldisphaeraceae archaeon]|nr:hypothetical protein [Caldisphaeraceae archaeon]
MHIVRKVVKVLGAETHIRLALFGLMGYDKVSSNTERLLKPRGFCKIVDISYSTLKQ